MEPIGDEICSEITADIEQGIAKFQLQSPSPLNKSPGMNTIHSETLCLISLPLEVRHCIYEYIFQVPVKDVFAYRPEHRHGNGLSLACSQLYGETRIRYYNTARYGFSSPRECQRFLDQVGPISHHIGSLVIYLNDDISEVVVLEDIFNILLHVSELHTLKLKIRQSQSPLLPPIYFPSARLSDPATYYDLCLRPPNHPLARVRSIRNLKVSGYTHNCELEEAILKLSVNMEDIAFKEERRIAFYPLQRTFGNNWFYSMKILDCSV